MYHLPVYIRVCASGIVGRQCAAPVCTACARRSVATRYRGPEIASGDRHGTQEEAVGAEGLDECRLLADAAEDGHRRRQVLLRARQVLDGLPGGRQGEALPVSSALSSSLSHFMILARMHTDDLGLLDPKDEGEAEGGEA